jgi:hypothetical protein
MPIEDPDAWIAGSDPATGPQGSQLYTLATQAGDSVDEYLGKAEAWKRIEELQERTGSGNPASG